MENKFVKIVSWLLCTCVLMLCAGIAGYEITQMRMNSSDNQELTDNAYDEAAVQTAGRQLPANAAAAEELEYYVARMNGRKLGVFVCSNNTERHAYDLDVDLSSLSESDRALLKQGIVLYNDEELAKFTEDFTS